MKIPQSILDQQYSKQVHVEGWNKGCVFDYLKTLESGEHYLRTPKTKKIFKTFNNLEYTKRNKPTIETYNSIEIDNTL